MTGWRVAFACGNAQAIKALGTVKSNIDSGVFTAVQDAAIEAFARPAGLRDRRPLRHVPAPSRPRARRARQDRHRGPHQAEGDHLRLGEGARRATPPRASPRRSSRRPTSSSPAGSAYGPSGEGYIRISLTTPDDRLEEAIERIEELALGGTSPRGTAPPPRNRRRPPGSSRARDPRRRRPRQPRTGRSRSRWPNSSGSPTPRAPTSSLRSRSDCDRPHPQDLHRHGQGRGDRRAREGARRDARRSSTTT